MAVDPTLNQMFEDLKYLIFRFCVLVLVDLLQNLDSWMIWSRIWFRREQDEEVLSKPCFSSMVFWCFLCPSPLKNPWRAEPLWRDCQVATKGRIHSCGGLRAGSNTVWSYCVDQLCCTAKVLLLFDRRPTATQFHGVWHARYWHFMQLEQKGAVGFIELAWDAQESWSFLLLYRNDPVTPLLQQWTYQAGLDFRDGMTHAMCYCPVSSIIFNHHESSWIIINSYQKSSSLIVNHHQSSSILVHWSS